jgi:hypothetical protein
MRYFLLLLRRLIARRRAPDRGVPVPDFFTYEPSIARDVSRRGVRFYSLCGCCGSRLQSSATLCDECAVIREARWRE